MSIAHVLHASHVRSTVVHSEERPECVLCNFTYRLQNRVAKYDSSKILKNETDTLTRWKCWLDLYI